MADEPTLLDLIATGVISHRSVSVERAYIEAERLLGAHLREAIDGMRRQTGAVLGHADQPQTEKKR